MCARLARDPSIDLLLEESVKVASRDQTARCREGSGSAQTPFFQHARLDDDGWLLRTS